MPNVTGKALAEALDRCEALLSAEKSAEPSEAALAQKEAAVAQLGALVASLGSISDAEVEALMPRLQAVLVANRYSLKWNGLRLGLAQVGKAKAAPAPAAPANRLDIVH